MTKIYLITGFLGSGKSTYLNNILSDDSKKTGVLINEFGKISVDTITLNTSNIDLIELKNGSIFCACLKDKFIDGLIALIKMDLDEIYIESSGLSDPSNIQSILEIIKKEASDSEFIFSGVICLVDAMYFLQQLDVLVSIKRQIEHSHLVIVNKIDMVDKNTLVKVKDTIEKINPRAKILSSSFGVVNYSVSDIEMFSIEVEDTTNTVESRPNSFILKFIKPISIDLIKSFLQACSKHLYRAKGYVEIDSDILKIDLVNETINIAKVNVDLQINPRELNIVVLLADKSTASSLQITKVINSMLAPHVQLNT